MRLLPPLLALVCSLLLVACASGSSNSGSGKGELAPDGTLSDQQRALWLLPDPYSEDADEVRTKSAAARTRIYARIVSTRRLSGYDLDHQLVGFDVELLGIWGDSRGVIVREEAATSRSSREGRSRTSSRGTVTTFEEADLKIGDTIRVFMRVLRKEGQYAPAELLARGDEIWAAFDALPDSRRETELQRKREGFPAVWTRGLTAMRMVLEAQR